MKFRLIYEGHLSPTGNAPGGGQKNTRPRLKQEIRRVFHKQLKQLWDTDRFLSTYKIDARAWNYMAEPAASSAYAKWAPDPREKVPLAELVAKNYREENKGFPRYQFVPLVMERYHLLCSLSVLLLHRAPPGSVLKKYGDLDNRIKTLIDALRCPNNKDKLVEGDEKPGEGETPFYCLLEDDKQVSGLAVETDMLLDPSDGHGDNRKVKVIVTVEIRPYYATLFNMSFA